jgi:DNA repair photolyase
MTKMFPFINAKPYNPLAGECKHKCVYCWVEPLKKIYPNLKTKYLGAPRIIDRELTRIKEYKAGDFAFACDCTDLFGEWIPKPLIQRILDAIATSPATFLLLTKNPIRYLEFDLPKNCVAGATIETDLIVEVSDAPDTMSRIEAMRKVKHRKMLSVEPIMQFTSEFPYMLVSCKPEFVAVGYDNYNHSLVEPDLDKTKDLIAVLKDWEIIVYEKTMRERLKLQEICLGTTIKEKKQ